MPPNRQPATSTGAILLDAETDYLGVDREHSVSASTTNPIIEAAAQVRTTEFTSALKNLLAITTYQKA